MNGVRLTIPCERFNAFSGDIARLNKRTQQVNRERKKHLFKRITRYPTGSHDGLVSIAIDIKDRRQVLWQELTGILEKYR